MAPPLRLAPFRRKVLTGAALALAGLVAAAGPAVARPGGWSDPYGPGLGGGWGAGGWGDSAWDSPRSAARGADPREGRVEVSRFVNAGPESAGLGKGAIAVGSTSGDSDFMAYSRRSTFEAAVVDKLIAQGYDTQHADAPGHQSASVRISRSVLVPAEEKRSPVSGWAAMAVGSRGSAYGLAVNVDMTKPRTALVQTRMDVRIADPASGAVLWEGYATIATREGDDKWDDTHIAGKLAEALFDSFPQAQKVDADHFSAPTAPDGPPPAQD